jgi:hypothetical protein
MRAAATVVPIGSASRAAPRVRMISSSALRIASASGLPSRTFATITSRASALATSPNSCPPMPSATSHRPRSASP